MGKWCGDDKMQKASMRAENNDIQSNFQSSNSLQYTQHNNTM